MTTLDEFFNGPADAIPLPRDVGVVGDETLARDGLDHRMASVLDRDFGVLAERSSHITITCSKAPTPGWLGWRVFWR